MNTYQKRRYIHVLNTVTLAVLLVATPGCITDRHTTGEQGADRYRIEQVMVDGRLQFAVCADCPEITTKVRASGTSASWVQSAYQARIRTMAEEIERRADVTSEPMETADTPPMPTPQSKVVPIIEPLTPIKDALVAQAPNPVPVPPSPTHFVVQFGFAKHELGNDAIDAISRVALSGKRVQQVTIRGFTDSIGPKHYNDVLAYSRAEEIKRELQRRGLVADYDVTGEGNCCYVDTNETPQGRASNRRAEVEIREASAQVAMEKGS